MGIITIEGNSNDSTVVLNSPRASIKSGPPGLYGEGVWKTYVLDASENPLGIKEREYYLEYNYVNGIAQNNLYACDSKTGDVYDAGVGKDSKWVILEFFKQEKLWKINELPGVRQTVLSGEQNNTEGTPITHSTGATVNGVLHPFIKSFLSESIDAIDMSFIIPFEGQTYYPAFTYKKSKCNFTSTMAITYLYVETANADMEALGGQLMPGFALNKWIQSGAGGGEFTLTDETVTITAEDLKNLPYGRLA